MASTLAVTYDESNKDVPCLCVAEGDLLCINVVKIFYGKKAKQLYEELTGKEEKKNG